MALITNPYFRTEIGNLHDASPDISSQASAKFKIRPTPGSKVMRAGILGPIKGTVPKIHYATPITQILFGSFVAVGDPTVS